MDSARSDLLSELAAHGRAHDAELSDRRLRLRNVEPETGALMALLIRAGGLRRILELGTSNGYSTVWLGDAAEAVGGHVASVDCDPARTSLAAETVTRAGLATTVELVTEDAARTLAAAPAGSADFIFLDAERPAYGGYWDDLRRALARPGLLVVDNAISHAHELLEFRELVDADPGVISALVTVGAGALLVTWA